MLGPREIDSLAYFGGRDVTQPGATRELAEFVAGIDPDVFAVSGIDAGDAFALATRFSRQWAYRGAQALFWKETFRAHEVHDRYLPFAALRPFDRRGLLLVDGEYRGKTVSLIATQFGTTRETLVRETRFAREQLRVRARFVLFAKHPAMRTDLRARDVEQIACSESGELHVYARGLDASTCAVAFG